MADLAQVESALVKADAAGDVEGAKVLAGEVRRLRSFADVKAEGVTKSSPPMMTPSGEKPLPSSVLDLSTPQMQAAFPPTRFALGAASPALGLAQLAAETLGQHGVTEHLKELERYKQEGRKTIGSEGADITDFAGTALSPAWRLLPNSATTLAGRTAEGALTGAAAGATAPVTGEGNYWENKAAQTGGGAALGAAVPGALTLAKKAGGMVYHGLVEPTFDAGQAAIKGRAYLEAAGNKANDIIDLLTRNKQIVKGSQPTAGEAATDAGRAEFSALQQSAARVKPSDYLARSDEQNAARVSAIQDFAGTPAKRAEAVAAREAAAGPAYAEGSAQSLSAASTGAGKSGFKQLLELPSTQAAVTRAEKLLQEETGKSVNLTGSGHVLTGDEAQKVKLAFDDLIRVYPKSAADTAELNALRDSRSKFVGWMEGEFPALGKARAAYKEASAPINQMDVGRELENRLTPALREDGKLRSTSFSGAVRDSASTIKKATGEPRFTNLEDVLTGRQLGAVHDVQADLARSDRHLDMARRGAQAGPNAMDLATGNLEREMGGKAPNLLNRHVMLMNAVINRLEGHVNRKLAAEMATEMLSPPKVGEALAAAQARELRNKMLAEQIRKLQRPAIAAGAAGFAAQQGE